MANNPYVNKVEYGGNTLIDLTSDTVASDNLLSGATAHDRSGAPIVGSVVTAEVVDNLTTQDATKALSANQGYVLNQNKVNKTDIADNLTTNDATKVLSAKQGKVLNEKIDGLYIEVTDSEPYVLRQGKGDMVDMELVGGSLAWNQLVQNGNFATTDNWSTTRATLTVSGNVGTLTATDASNWQGMVQSQTISGTTGHKILVALDIKATTSNAVKMGVSLYATSISTNRAFDVNVTSSWQSKATVIQTTTDITGVRIVVNGTPYFAVNDTLNIRNINVIDLTQMFGSTIADYIYNLEQATSGSGVAWFRQYFPKLYYAYQTSKIESVNVSARKVVGKNLCSGIESGGIDTSTGQNTSMNNTYRSTGYIPITNGQSYIFSGLLSASSTIRIFHYDGGKNFISSNTISGTNNVATSTVSVANTCYIRFHASNTVFTDITKVQVEYGTTATAYEPYKQTTYPLPTTQLRGIPKLVDGKLAFDGDILKSSGSGSARYKLYHLYDYTWTYESGEQNFYTTGITDFKLPTNNTTPIKGICGKYLLTDRTTLYNGLNKSIAGALNGRIWIKDTSYTDATQFKNSLNGVYLVVELATPTAISASLFQNPQRADANGTEEFVDYGVEQSTRDVAIPCGHNSTYTSADVIQPLEDYVDGYIKQEVDALNEQKSDILALGYDESGRTTASRNYGKGEYFYKDGRFEKVLANINVGSALTLNTNYAHTSVNEELYALNNQWRTIDSFSFTLSTSSSLALASQVVGSYGTGYEVKVLTDVAGLYLESFSISSGGSWTNLAYYFPKWSSAVTVNVKTQVKAIDQSYDLFEAVVSS